MASLTIRKLPEEAKRRLRLRAAEHGRSMEEEARQLLMAAVANDQDEPKTSIFEMLYEASRPGFDLPQVPDSPASHAVFDE